MRYRIFYNVPYYSRDIYIYILNIYMRRRRFNTIGLTGSVKGRFLICGKPILYLWIGWALWTICLLSNAISSSSCFFLAAIAYYIHIYIYIYFLGYIYYNIENRILFNYKITEYYYHLYHLLFLFVLLLHIFVKAFSFLRSSRCT